MSATTCDCLRFDPDDQLARALGLGAPALMYARMGYAVLPLARGGKRPHRMLGRDGGVHHATANHSQIRQWWLQDKAANIGVATGSPSRLVVVDLDVKHGADGPMELEAFLAPWPLVMPYSTVARTPSGGFHIWLRTPWVKVPERPGILPGVDVKGDGGYVVAPPSMLLIQPMTRPGEPAQAVEVPVPYEWAAGCPHAAPLAPSWMPGWLATAVATGSAQPQHEAAGGVDVDADELAKTGIEQGRRNRTIYILACSLYRRMGTDPGASAVVLDKLRAVWDATSHSDFTWQEVLTCAESARRFVERSKATDMRASESYIAWLHGRS